MINIKKLNKKHNFVPMDCPCCDEFTFTQPTKLNIKLEGEDEVYDEIMNFQCTVCGWVYDLEQTENPNLKNGNNEDSLNEHKEWFKKMRLENPEYNYLEAHEPPKEPLMCPICGKYQFEDDNNFDICPSCGWENDGVQTNDPDYAGGANDLSLNQYKKEYEQKIKENPNYYWQNQFNNNEKK